MPIEETKNFIREQQFDSKECEQGTFFSKKVGDGVILTLCKLKVCVRKSGLNNCHPTAQSISYPKKSYRFVQGKIYPK